MHALTLLMASFSLSAPTDDGVASSRVTDASGTASVRIVKSYRLKREHLGRPVEGAAWRKTVIVDRDGERRDIDLVEFE